MEDYSYINLVEEEISKIFNKIYDSFIINKKLEKIYKESSKIEVLNKNLFNIILNLLNELDVKKLQNILKKKNNYQKIILIIKKYITYYLILYFSFIINNENFYKNLIIKLQKIDTNNKILFNLDDSNNILDIYIFITEFMKILDLYKNNLDEFNNKILKNNNYKNFIKFINKEVNQDNLNILTAKNELLYHNNIVFILIKNIYLKQDVKIVYNILEEDDDTVYNYINIVVPIVNYIDQNLISNSLNLQEKKTSIIKDIFYLLNEKEIKENILDDEKINILCKKNIITPIVDDILRYHKDSELYDKNVNTYDKNNTKIKYITSKVNEVQNLYYKEEKEYQKTKQLFYKRLNYRNAILYNDLEEIDIIRKLFLKGKTALENNEFINNLLDIRKYAYINFNSIKLSGFSYKFKKTVPSIRLTNIKYNDPKKYAFLLNNKIETRVAPEDEKVNIVGFVLTNNLINNIKIKDLKNIKKNENYETIYKNLFDVLNKKNNNNNYYWIFSKNDYKFIKIFQKNFSFENIDKCSLCKYIYLNIYDIASEMIYNQIKNNLNKIKNISFYNLYNYVNLIQLENFNINYLLSKNNIDQKITKLVKNEKDINDNNENIIKGLEGNIIKLPIINIKKKKINKIVFDLKNKNTDDNIIEKNNFICQHHIDYKQINNLKNKNEDLYSKKLFNFIKKYSYEKNNILLCKSCNQILDIKKYIVNIHSLSGEEGISININSNINLKDNKKYNSLTKLIDFIDKLTDKISLICNLNIYTGNLNENKYNRKQIIKKVLDLIIENYNFYIKLSSKEKEKKINILNKVYGISTNYTKFFIFKLVDDIFKFKSKDEDKYKKRKINNIVIYITFALLLDINKNHIINLNPDNLNNIILFKKYGKSLFDKLNIKINNNNDVESILKYPVLCYYIYYIACLLIKFNLWYFEDATNSKFDFIKVKIIIHSFVDMINVICENNMNSDNYIFNSNISLFYFKQKQIFNKLEVFNQIQEKQNKTVNYDKTKNIIKINKYELPGIKLKGYDKFEYEHFIIKYLNQCFVYNIKLKEEVDNLLYFTNKEIQDLKNKLEEDTNTKIIKSFDVNYKSRKLKLSNNEIKKLDDKTVKKILSDYYDYNNQIIFKKYNLYVDKLEIYKKKISKYDIIVSKGEYFNFKILDEFIYNIKNLFDNKIYINKKKIFITEDQYIINHDINGNLLQKFIYIQSNYGKIISNHNTFKQDVIEIRYEKYFLYYNLYSNLYLGFKDNFNFIINKKGRFLKINYSLRNLLLLIGLNSKYHVIVNSDIKNNIYDFLKNRNNNLNILINIFIKNLYSIKYKKANTKFKSYEEKISNINLTNKNKKIFKNYELIKNNIEFNFKFNYDIIKNKYLNIIDILKNSDNDLYFYYIINDLNNLFKINKQNDNIYIFKLFIEILVDHIKLSNEYNKNLDLLFYKKILTFDYLNLFNYDLNNNDIEIADDITEEEMNIIKENKYTDEESNNALDYEVDGDADSDVGEGEELIQDLD